MTHRHLGHNVIYGTWHNVIYLLFSNAGHPTPRLNFIDVATGSLGQGLSVACGMAYVGKFIDKASYRTYCLMGDGESMEGNVWEALNFAGFYKLDNLCAIIDVNRLGMLMIFNHE